MSLQQLAILSSIALMVESTEASPFWWPEKRAVASEKEDEPNKKVTKAAADDDNKFSNKPTAQTSKKPATSAKPKPTSAKPSAAKPSSSAVPSPSAIISSSAIPSPTSVVPPLMVTNTPSSTSASISPSTTPKSVAESDSQGGVSGGAIGGIVAAIVIIVLGAVAYFVVRRRKQQQQQRNRRMSNKPDPFTMGYGSDQAFHSQPPPPQMQQTYQHQYGVQPSIAVTSPTSPTSPYYNNQPFSDANNHIIAESMIPAVLPPKHDTAYQPDVYQQQQEQQQLEQQQYGDQQYQSQLQPQPQQQQYQPQPQQQQYQPQPMYQPQQEQIPQQPMSPTSAVDSNNTLVGAPTTTMMAAAATGFAVSSAGTLQQSNKLLAPTQPGSVGVFHVAATYTPTLSDEIDIQTGDQVEVLVEYDDGWCQGINLTRGNAKGVFPKHCIDYSSGATAASVISSGGGNSEVDRVKRVSSMYIA